MKEKLKIFTDYIKWLLPLEVEYLVQSEKFEDTLNREILARILSYHSTGKLNLPENVDKRKYSYLSVDYQPFEEDVRP